MGSVAGEAVREFGVPAVSRLAVGKEVMKVVDSWNTTEEIVLGNTTVQLPPSSRQRSTQNRLVHVVEGEAEVVTKAAGVRVGEGFGVGKKGVEVPTVCNPVE